MQVQQRQQPWQGAIAIVTGAASGIGFGLAKGLLARGAEVWLADIHAQAVQSHVEALGPKAHAAVLDVANGAALQALVEGVAARAGRLDFMFNNAGIGVAGEWKDFAPEHLERIVDVNIRGVAHGCLAAYRWMKHQGSGHIVNTASLAGLTPVPLLAAYAMSKHAVVGLSLSLRAEGAAHGVKVSAICPAAIDTPLLEGGGPADLPPLAWRPDLRAYLTALAGAPYPVQACVDDALRGVERNKGLIVLPARARGVALAYRLLPGLAERIGLAQLRRTRAGR